MSDDRICHQRQKTGHTYKISMGTIISEHTGRSSCLRWCQRTTHHSFIFILSSSVPNDVRRRASLLRNPRLPCTRGHNKNLSNIACTIGAKEACAHIFQLLAHICFEMGAHSPPYSSWGWPTKTSQRARGKKYHVLQPLANSLSAVWGMFLKNRKIFPVVVSSMSVRTSPPHDQQLRESLKLS